MVRITTDLGSFEAETEKEVMRLVRRAKKEQAAKEAVCERNREIARLRADSNGYKILRGEMRVDLVKVGEPCCPKVEVTGIGSSKITVEGMNGIDDRAVITFLHYSLIGALISPAGYVMAVFLQDLDTPETVLCYAVGVEANQYAFADLDLSMDKFGGR